MPDVALLGLVLVAIVIGYSLGWCDQKRRRADGSRQLSKDYFVGLNYLINEQTDEAIDVFIKALNVNDDTVDTYLALGSLFSRRGEVEKSIRFHQDLLARPSLTSTQSFQVQLALAQDYFFAGLLDRAESILIGLSCQNHELLDQALQQLLRVYEQEREWEKAADVAERLRRTCGEYFAEILAHYYCEQCEIALGQNDRMIARRLIRQAFARDKNSVRASLLLGQMEFDQGSYKEAIKVLQRISVQDISFMPLSLPLLEKSFELTGSLRGFGAHLGRCLNERPGTAIIIAMTRLLIKESGEFQAVNFLTAQLERHPTLKGLNELIDLQRRFQGDDLQDNVLALIHRLMDRMVELKPVFSCGRCGFSGKKMHWQCPSCHNWGVVSPIQGFEGE